jgi:hypothetical protein
MSGLLRSHRRATQAGASLVIVLASRASPIALAPCTWQTPNKRRSGSATQLSPSGSTQVSAQRVSPCRSCHRTVTCQTHMSQGALRNSVLASHGNRCSSAGIPPCPSCRHPVDSLFSLVRADATVGGRSPDALSLIISRRQRLRHPYLSYHLLYERRHPQVTQWKRPKVGDPLPPTVTDIHARPRPVCAPHEAAWQPHGGPHTLATTVSRKGA